MKNSGKNQISVALLEKQILFIAAIILVFALLWSVIWVFVTSRCVVGEGDEMKIKMIEVSKNLPFNTDSQIAHVSTGIELKGDLPVLDGAAALFPLYSSITEAIYPEESVIYNRETDEFAENSALQFHNTVRGFDALIDGSVDVFFSAYPSKEQMECAARAGVEIEFVPIGKEAFVFLVNTNNPVDSLTSEQLRDIFTGKYKNWIDVGGANRPVHPIKRIAGSGSQSALEAFLGGEEVRTNPLGFMGVSIGYSFRWYTSEVVGDSNVKILSVDGIYPDEDAIQNDIYPLTNTFFAMYRKDNQKQNIKALLDFILSKEGQDLIEASGYCRIAN